MYGLETLLYHHLLPTILLLDFIVVPSLLLHTSQISAVHHDMRLFCGSVYRSRVIADEPCVFLVVCRISCITWHGLIRAILGLP